MNDVLCKIRDKTSERDVNSPTHSLYTSQSLSTFSPLIYTSITHSCHQRTLSLRSPYVCRAQHRACQPIIIIEYHFHLLSCLPATADTTTKPEFNAAITLDCTNHENKCTINTESKQATQGDEPMIKKKNTRRHDTTGKQRMRRNVVWLQPSC